MSTAGPEKPRHIDGRINRIGTEDLLKAFGSPADDLAGLRAFVGGQLRRPAWPLPEWADAIRSTPAADDVLAAAAPLLEGVDVTGLGRGRSQLYGFHYLGWLAPGVQAWQLTGDERYLQAFERHFDEWVERRDSVIGEWPGLDVIWYSLGTWARCRSLLPTLEVLTNSPLSDCVWGRLVATLVGGARWAYDEHDVFRHGNWQLVCATELLHLSTVLPSLVESAAWAERAHQRIEEHLALDIYPDGGHYERSPGYHGMVLDALQTAARIDPAVAAHPRFAAMHTWLCELVSSGGWLPHLQDSGVVWPAASLLRGSYLLDDPALARVAAQWLPDSQFATEAAAYPAWTDEERQARWMHTLSTAREQAAPELPATTVLPESGYTILRSDEVRAVINHGPHIEHELESHSHRAVLDLVLDGWQQPLLWEAGGPPSYDDPEYLTWYQSGRGHNTVLVDDRELSTDRGVTVEPLIETDQLAVFSGRHRGNGVRQARTVAMVREEPAYVVVTDSAAGPHTFRACWHALHPWRQVGPLAYDAAAPDGPGLLLIEAGDAATPSAEAGIGATPSVEARIDATPSVEPGNGATTSVETSEGVARRPFPDRRVAEYGPLHTLSLGRSSGDFTTVLVPHAGSEPPSVSVAQADGELVVEYGNTVDRVSSSSWTRIRSGKLSWATGWRVLELAGLMKTSEPVDVLAAVTDGLLRLEITCPGRCAVWVPPGAGIRVDGIAIDAEVDEGWARLTLPYAGRWLVEGAQHD
ncbi:heparinase II/III family protein [Kribbella kalugense]|uniref:Heparinase II/III-like protein n=1 Tax=Kribbella kalugense TaxID=2512221 RepID=A0A4R8A3L5_9ACTN|nr:heparinase II/III family protein [Kribbella kalugense]TDW24028.1 heparinase II/III-like protein [Kribbella kalugense]